MHIGIEQACRNLHCSMHIFLAVPTYADYLFLEAPIVRIDVFLPTGDSLYSIPQTVVVRCMLFQESATPGYGTFYFQNGISPNSGLPGACTGNISCTQSSVTALPEGIAVSFNSYYIDLNITFLTSDRRTSGLFSHNSNNGDMRIRCRLNSPSRTNTVTIKGIVHLNVNIHVSNTV